MNWLPYDQTEFYVRAGREEVVQALRSKVRSRAHGDRLKITDLFGQLEKPFRGAVGEDAFKVRRVIRYQNSWLPVIKGEVTGRGADSRVKTTMRLSHFVSAFMAVWMAFFLVISVSILTEPLSWLTLLPLGFILLGYVGTQAAFWYEARKARRLLEEIFDDIG